MNESPAFKKMKEEGKTSKAPLSESFGQWKNLKIVLLALFGLVAGQAVVWYTGSSTRCSSWPTCSRWTAATANIMVAVSLVLGTPFFVVFGTLSDKIGRKPIILAGLPGRADLLPAVQALTKPPTRIWPRPRPPRRSASRPTRPAAPSRAARSPVRWTSPGLRHRQARLARARPATRTRPCPPVRPRSSRSATRN
jgi:hypothetical protein